MNMGGGERAVYPMVRSCWFDIVYEQGLNPLGRILAGYRNMMISIRGIVFVAEREVKSI
jgi:hypothetical protein